MFKRVAALIVVGMGGLVPAVASARAAVSPTSTPPAAPVPVPAPTEQPTGLGTDWAMDLLANACFSGTMQACDDLYAQSPAGSAYEPYGDTCAGRQPAETGLFCTTVFTDTVVQPTSPATTPPTTVIGVVTETMAAIHTICQPQALSAYAADYATKVPPTAQGVVAELAAEQGVAVDAFLTAVVDDLLESETQITVNEAYRPAETPVGEATLTEYGLLIGRYLDCLFEATQIPQDIFDNLLNTDEGSGTWAGYTMTWGDNGEGDFTIAFTSPGSTTASTAPVTTAPTTPTTAPAAPTTVPADPTTVPGGTGGVDSTADDEHLTCDLLISFGEDIVDEGVTECDDELQAVFDSIMTEKGPDAFDDFVSDNRVLPLRSDFLPVNGQAYLWGLIACFELSDQGASSAERDYVSFFMEKLPGTTEEDAQAVFEATLTHLCPLDT